MPNRSPYNSKLIDAVFEKVVDLRFKGIEIARKYCLDDKNGISCSRYHGIRFLQRYLKVNNVLDVQYQAFNVRLKSIWEQQVDTDQPLEILVCGSADFVPPAIVSATLGELDLNHRITILDRCRTPIELCKDFNQEHNLPWEYIQADILEFKPEKRYDLICSDRFLGFFDEPGCRRLIGKWQMLLKPAGTALTVVQKRPKPRSQQEFNYRVGKFREALERCEEEHGYSIDELCEMSEGFHFKRLQFPSRKYLSDLVRSGGLEIASMWKFDIPPEDLYGRDSFDYLAIEIVHPNS